MTEWKLQSESYSLVLFVVIVLFCCFDLYPGRVTDKDLFVYFLYFGLALSLCLAPLPVD